MYKQIKDLSPEEIGQIIYLANQGDYKFNRVNLICNLFSINKEQLEKILIKYSHSKVLEKVEADYS